MPSLSANEIKQFSGNVPVKHFVETGTYEGETVTTVLKMNSFDFITSIELSPKYAKEAQQKFQQNSNVKIIEGDSSVELQRICPLLRQATFFWLDGHFSGGDTAQGTKDCPLHEEAHTIMNTCVQECVVAIDDVRLFDKKLYEDWTGITVQSIINIFLPRIRSFSFYPSIWDSKDRLVIHLDAKVI